MKKYIALVLTLIFVLSLAGSNEYQSDGRDTSPNHDETAEYWLTITADGESINPYQHFLYSGQWDGEGFWCADGLSLTTELPGLVEEGLIPQLDYDEDFKVVPGSEVELGFIALYDSKYNELERLQDVSELSELDKGEYYVGIVANKQGEYIEEAEMNEYSGYTCVFKLVISK